MPSSSAYGYVLFHVLRDILQRLKDAPDMCLPFLRMAIVECLSIVEYNCDLLNNKNYSKMVAK